MESGRVVVRHDIVRIPVQGQDQWKIGAHIFKG